MNLMVNGKAHQTSAKTVALLLSELGLVPSQVAVEHNGTVLFRQEFGTTILKKGDHLEIIHAVAGG